MPNKKSKSTKSVPLKPQVVKKTMSDDAHPVADLIKKLYKKSVPMLLFETVLFIGAAILIFINPMKTLTNLTLIFGIVLGLVGFYQTFVGLFGKDYSLFSQPFNVIVGILNIILGVVFFMHPAGTMVAIIYIFAILFLFKGVQALVLSVQMWRGKLGNYMMNTFISVLMIVWSLVVMFFPSLGAITAMYYIAITLILYAGADIYMYSGLVKLKKMARELSGSK